MSEEKKESKTKEMNYFEILNSINVSDKTEQKNGLTYLSWAFAWGEIKKLYPNANYKIYETESGCIYWTDGKTCWVKTGVTINDIEHIEYLPVMDYKNKSIPVGNVTSFDVNKAIQRSLTKAVARHGLGLYIYAGEDLPEDDKKEREEQNKKLDELREKVKSFPQALELLKPRKRKLIDYNEEELNSIIKELEELNKNVEEAKEIKEEQENEQNNS